MKPAVEYIKELFDENVNGNTFISLSTRTEPMLKGGKKNPFKGRTVKVMEGANVMVFQNKRINGYDAMVRRRLEKEGKNPETFKLGSRPWGVRLENSPLVEHDGKYYLEVIFLASGKVHYEVDGVETSADQIEGLAKSSEGDQGGLSDKVIIRTFALDSVKELVVNHRRYVFGQVV